MGRLCIIYLREVAIVESGHNEWKTKSAVEEVGQGEMKNQDCFACLQLRDSIWVPDALSLHFDPVRDFKCDICHLSRTYGRAISVTRLAGAPIKMTIARFAMKNSLFCTISSGWQPEKLRLGEEVVHSKA